MRVDIYVSRGRQQLPRYGLVLPDSPVCPLPRPERWKYVRSGDTAEFHLPEAIKEEIERRGFWALQRTHAL